MLTPIILFLSGLSIGRTTLSYCSPARRKPNIGHGERS